MRSLLSLGKYWAIEPDTFNNLEALVSKDAPVLENTRTVRIQNGVAVIPVSGVITGRMDFLTYVLGGTALDILAKDFRTALENSDIRAIILDFDSPGGIAVGPAEMADMIFNARGSKPIISYVGRNWLGSAAYWLASAADKIVAHPAALLGSIGVVTAVPVQEQPDESGTKCYEIVSSNAKAKRPDPRTEDGIKTIKAELDALEAQFIGSVAKFRNISEEKIRNDFGKGAAMIGHEALQRSMADELGSFESVLASLTVTSKNERNITMDKKTDTPVAPEITASYIQSQYPEVAKAIADEAYNKGMADGNKTAEESYNKGVLAERERILAIEKIAMPGHEDLIEKAKADGSVTAETVAMQMVMAEKNEESTILPVCRLPKKNFRQFLKLPLRWLLRGLIPKPLWKTEPKPNGINPLISAESLPMSLKTIWPTSRRKKTVRSKFTQPVSKGKSIWQN